jgi:transcriptional regulator with XRE-family HTH domain
MWVGDIQAFRTKLGLSRSELSRFLGVSEATIVRWESSNAMSQPKGIQALLLATLSDAAQVESFDYVAQVVRHVGMDHRRALRTLLNVAMPA